MPQKGDSAEGARICEVCGCPARSWLKLYVVCRELSLSQRTGRKLVKEGRLVGHQAAQGGPWLVKHTSVHEFLNLAEEEENPDA